MRISLQPENREVFTKQDGESLKKLIAFDETNFEFQGEQNSDLCWLTPNGDGLTLFHFDVPPDIEADLHDIQGLRAFYRQIASGAGLGVLEIETGIVDGCITVRTLFKAAQGRTGRTYLGALTLPFRDFSYVFKIQSEEKGTTGVREAVVTSWQMNRELSIDLKSRQLIGWLDDPYDLNERGPMTRNISERPEYDARFPGHPLSHARWVLNHLQKTMTIDNSLKQKPKFSLTAEQ